MGRNALYPSHDLTNNANRGCDVNGMKEFVEADKTARALPVHRRAIDYRRLRDFGFERPAAQASISA